MDFMLRLPNCTDRHQMLIILTNSTSDIWILRLTKQMCWRDFGKIAYIWNTYHQMLKLIDTCMQTHDQQTSVKIESKYKAFIFSRKYNWTYYPQNASSFVNA